MRTMSIAMVATLLVGGCAPGAGDAVVGSAPANIPEFGVMSWPDIHRYRAFFAEGRDFDSDDESTWRFVFVTPFTPSRRDAWAVAALDGERQMLGRVSRHEAGGTETRRYRSVDNPEVELEVTLVSTGRGDESTAFSGTVQIVAPARGASVQISGDCGA